MLLNKNLKYSEDNYFEVHSIVINEAKLKNLLVMHKWAY